MSAFKGTPGPWQVVNGTDVFTPLAARNGAGVRAHETDGWYIADCSMGETQTEDGAQEIPVLETMANARLIAAAPELLDALTEILGPSDDPSIGWRGLSASDPEHLFSCEYCRAEHTDCAAIDHADDCRVAKARAAIAKAAGGDA